MQKLEMPGELLNKKGLISMMLLLFPRIHNAKDLS